MWDYIVPIRTSVYSLIKYADGLGKIKKIRFKSAKILVELRITLGITSSYARRTPRWARCTESAVTK